MRELLADLQRFDGAGPAARAVVLGTWGSAPRPAGAVLLAAADGRMAGSVSGGCVENAVLQEIAAARESGRPKQLRYEVNDETAWAVGLACGGTIEILVEPAVSPEVRRAAADPLGSVVVTRLSDGARWRVREDKGIEGSMTLVSSVVAEALAALRAERSAEGAGLFYEVFARRPELVIVGAGHIAQELVPLARRMGFRTLVLDGREAFLTVERFPDADELVRGWPAEQLPRFLGPASYVAVLSHDPKFDEPCVRLALRSPARYVGVIGSKKNQEKRRAALRAEGFTPEEIGRLRGPIGLPLGGKQPNEVALSIVAEIVKDRYS